MDVDWTLPSLGLGSVGFGSMGLGCMELGFRVCGSRVLGSWASTRFRVCVGLSRDLSTSTFDFLFGSSSGA